MMYYCLVIFSVFAAACAQMLLKQGSSRPYTVFGRQYINSWVIGGYVVMLGCLMLNIFAMSRGVQAKEVSVIESLSYLFVPCLAFFLFKERLTIRKVLAIAVIIAGILIFFI